MPRSQLELKLDDVRFDGKMNMQMFTQSISGAFNLYDKLKAQHGLHCPNEAELLAYFLLSSGDPEVSFGKLQAAAQRGDVAIFKAPILQRALRAGAGAARDERVAVALIEEGDEGVACAHVGLCTEVVQVAVDSLCAHRAACAVQQRVERREKRRERRGEREPCAAASAHAYPSPASPSRALQ